RAGGVNDVEAARSEFVYHTLAHAVGGNGDAALLDRRGSSLADVAFSLVGAGELAHANGFELAHDVGVVDDLADAVDGRLGAGFALHDLHGAAHAHAKSHFSGSDDLRHRSFSPALQIQYRCRGISPVEAR